MLYKPTLLSAMTLATALLTSTGLVLISPTPVLAADQEISSTKQKVNFNVAAGQLTAALNQFGQQAGILLSYSPELASPCKPQD